MNVLILGGNGFIGSAVARRLVAEGHQVRALARSTAVASRRAPDIVWLRADLALLTDAEDWSGLLAGIDAIVNCAGALQDGARDDVVAVQERAMLALYAAAAATRPLIVQISANTGGSGAGTTFLASKAKADRALAQSSLPHVILRPAIVIGRDAHGGSALLRALAACPVVTPLVHGESRLQFTALDDVADAVAEALAGTIPENSDLTIASPEILTLRESVAAHRRWLGLAAARPLAVPAVLARWMSTLADGLGHLGWRSPLRSSALAVAAGGVIANPVPDRRCDGLAQTLARHPAGVQDVWFARLYLMKPAIIGSLALFWIASGIFALAAFDLAAAHLVATGIPPGLARLLTAATSIADIAIGLLVAFRRFAAIALLAMVVMTFGYVVAGTILQPSLWLDPLGPLVKVLPGTVLALVALAILEER